MDEAQHRQHDNRRAARNTRINAPGWTIHFHHERNGQRDERNGKYPRAGADDVAHQVAYPGAHLAGNAKPHGGGEDDGYADEHQGNRIRIIDSQPALRGSRLLLGSLCLLFGCDIARASYLAFLLFSGAIRNFLWLPCSLEILRAVSSYILARLQARKAIA